MLTSEKLRTTPVKRSIATFAALLAFVAFADARRQTSSVVKKGTLQIDVDARPAIGQFVPGDDDVQHLVYELFVTNWNDQDLRFASVDVEDAARGQRLAQDPKDDSPHTSGFAKVNGVKLHYLDWGGKGDAVLFITGMGSTAHIYDWMALKFTDKYRVLALTRRGYGESEKPETGYDPDTLTEDVRLFLDHMKIKRVHLIGHSSASNELSNFASRYPKRTLKLVYLDAAYDRREIHKMDEGDPLPLPAPSSDPLQKKIDDLYFAAMKSYVPTYKKIKAPVLSFYAIFGKHPELRDDTPHDKQKAAELYMETIVRPFQRQLIESFRRELPSARVIELTGTHHFFFLDPAKRDEVVETIRDFLEGSK